MNILHVAMLFVAIIGAIYAFCHLMNSTIAIVKNGETTWWVLGFIVFLSGGFLFIGVASLCSILNILGVI